MKKTTLIHSELSYIIAKLGHLDMIVIADSGLPIPKDVIRIDLALKKGVPGFIETVEVVLSECCVERIWIANEMEENNKLVYKKLSDLMDRTPTEKVSHEQFKEIVKDKAVAVIRTGEYSPYANVILQSGVVF